MKKVVCTRQIAMSAETLWRFLRDFYADWHPAMAWCEHEPDNIRRFAGADDGTIYREQLIYFDHRQRIYRYVALQGIAGIESYVGQLRVSEHGEGCEVAYSAEIHAQQPRLDAVAAGTEFIFNMGLDEIETIVERKLIIQTEFIKGNPKLAVDVAGKGKGELVLFLHGIGGARSNWRGQLTALAPICQAVALDFRGYGGSELGHEPITVANQVADIIRVMASFSAKKVHLVGLSYGSWLAACFAHLHPKRVASLTCCAGSTGMSEADSAEIERFRKLRLEPMEAGQTPAEIAKSVVNFISGPSISTAARAELMASMVAIPRETYIAALRCFLNPPFKIAFEQFSFPTQFIAGAFDKLASPAEMGGIAKRVPNSRFCVVEDAGHLINLEQPERFNQLIHQFVQEATYMSQAVSARQARKARKAEAILTAAMAVFARQGYTGASLDAIAQQAGVSKPTLYQYFGNKEKLFEAVLEQAAQRILAPLEAYSPEGTPLVVSMLNFSRNYAKIVLSPDILSLGRLVLGEVTRFPHIGKHYYENGPQQALNGIARYLESLADGGKLIIEDSELAAHDFWSLILSAPREMCQLMPEMVMSLDEIDRFIHNGLRVFLKAYSANPATDLEALEKLFSS